MAATGFKGTKFNSRDFVKLFRSFDTDGNGFIDKGEMDKFLTVMFKELHGKEPTKQEIKSYKEEVLSKYDENQDGRFTMKELESILDLEDNILLQFNLKNELMNFEDFMKIWTHYDIDKSGTLEADEVEGFLYEYLKIQNIKIRIELVKEVTQEFFDTYDTNKDGHLSIGEMTKVLNVEKNFMEQFKGDDKLTKEQLSKLFNHYDKDNSGEIEGEEITALLRDILLQQEGEDTVLTVDKLNGIKDTILSMFDTDGDGKLSKDELSLLFSCNK